MKFHPIPQMPFLKPLGCRVYSIFASLFSFMKDNSVFFLAQTWYTLESSPNLSCHIWNHMLVSLYTLHHSSMSWEIILLYFFSWNFVIFTKVAHQSTKILGKFQLLRLISPNLYFGRILLLKVYTISAKKITDELCLLILKIDSKFEQKPISCFKIDKNLVNFDPGTKKSPKFALWLVPLVQSI